MKTAVIFDLGNTLVSYYTREQWPTILHHSIDEVVAYLRQAGQLGQVPRDLRERVEAQRGESSDHAVVPLQERLARIFDLSWESLPDGVGDEICRRFMKPTFDIGRRYDDVLPTLARLRTGELKLGILSNSPWGSPAHLWREELHRQGLADTVDAAVFCCDVGYRKPAPHGFERIMGQLGVTAAQCLFVGDDPRWDITGPQRLGMEAILIDRGNNGDPACAGTIRDLTELTSLLRVA
jgi:putative hydrolase of the HAD superfamily